MLTKLQQQIIDKITEPDDRSKQRKIGPSQIGGCPFHIGKTLALYLPEQYPDLVHNENGGNLATWIGKALHFYLEHTLGLGKSESKWGVYYLEGYGQISGSVDLIYEDEIFDYKSASKTNYDDMAMSYRLEPDRLPKTIYRAQQHLYAYAVRKGGYDINWVNLMVIPKHKASFSDIRFYREAYNEEMALKALDRLEKIWQAVKVGELEQLPRDDDCYDCSNEWRIA